MSASIHSGCDRGMAHAAKASQTPHATLVLAATILASSLAFVDGSVVNVGLPAIGADLHAGAGDLQWVVNAYLLPLSALLLLGGAAGDRFGRVRLLVWGTALFGLASIACAIAPNTSSLLAARAAQGVGAAMLMPNSLAILGASFTGEARGRAIGIWAAMGAAMGAIGPVLGGWLIDTIGWRSIFLINLPLAAGAIVLALLFVKDRRAEKGATLDLAGGLLATAALGAITWGLTVGSGRAGWTGAAIVTLGVGVVLMLAFLVVERSKRDKALLPLTLFGSSTFTGLTVLTFLLYGALGALMVLVPYVLIEAAGFTSAGAGAALLPFALILAFASPLMGALAGRIGSRLPLSIGPVVVALGFVLALRIGRGADYWTDVLPLILVISVGMAGAVAPLTNAVLSSVEDRYTGTASGFNSAVARTGGMVATALLGSVLGAQGDALIGGFHGAMIACAVASLCAGASAFLLVKPEQSGR